jgi:hypothetical protein
MLKNPSRRGADFEQEKKIESTSDASAIPAGLRR